MFSFLDKTAWTQNYSILLWLFGTGSTVPVQHQCSANVELNTTTNHISANCCNINSVELCKYALNGFLAAIFLLFELSIYVWIHLAKGALVLRDFWTLFHTRIKTAIIQDSVADSYTGPGGFSLGIRVIFPLVSGSGTFFWKIIHFLQKSLFSIVLISTHSTVLRLLIPVPLFFFLLRIRDEKNVRIRIGIRDKKNFPDPQHWVKI
jgi:hypothetical protein